jgi:thymidylate synthase ThyX
MQLIIIEEVTDLYKSLLDAGVAECARMILPMASTTTFILAEHLEIY